MKGRTWLILAVSVFLVVGGVALARGKGGEVVHAMNGEEFASAMTATPGAVIVDVRTPAEFAAGHIPGAVNIDYEDPSFASALAGLDHSASYFVYCRSGRRSGLATNIMKGQGFTSIYDLKGGIVGSPGLVQ